VEVLFDAVARELDPLNRYGRGHHDAPYSKTHQRQCIVAFTPAWGLRLAGPAADGARLTACPSRRLFWMRSFQHGMARACEFAKMPGWPQVGVHSGDNLGDTRAFGGGSCVRMCACLLCVCVCMCVCVVPCVGICFQVRVFVCASVRLRVSALQPHVGVRCHVHVPRASARACVL